MTFSKFFGFGILLAITTALLTVFLNMYVNIAPLALNIIVWFLVLILAIALVRRLGVLNFLEGLLVFAVWLFFRAFTDILITAPLLGLGMYGKSQIWISYLILFVGVFFFHKKRHVHIRKEQRKHHGHH